MHIFVIDLDLDNSGNSYPNEFVYGFCMALLVTLYTGYLVKHVIILNSAHYLDTNNSLEIIVVAVHSS